MISYAYKEVKPVEIRLLKQPQKYLASVGVKTRNKLYKALEHLKTLDGDIIRLKGCDNLYRFKIEYYRILFSIDSYGYIIIVSAIDTRTNIKY